MNHFKKGILTLGIVALFSACSFREDKTQGSDNSALLTRPIGFDTLTSAVILPHNCLQCHNGATGADGVNLSSYSSVMSKSGLVVADNPDQSLLYQAVTGQGVTQMPPGGPYLSAIDTQMISNWISEGAPAVAAAPTSSPTPAPSASPLPVITLDPNQPMGFTQITEGFINKYGCITCHSGPKPSHKIDLSNFTAVMAKPFLIVPEDAAASNIIRCLGPAASPRMPKGGAPVDASDLQALTNWVNAGAPEAAGGAPTPMPSWAINPIPSGISSEGAMLRSYVADIAPILKTSCVSCHGGATPASGKDLSSYAGLMAAADDAGAVVVPGSAFLSQFYDTLFSNNTQGFQLMPQKGAQLPEATLQMIADWINQGAVESLRDKLLLRNPRVLPRILRSLHFETARR